MFNFQVNNGFLTTRMFVALTVALCVWSILTLTGVAMTGQAPTKEDESVVGENAEEGTLLLEQEYHTHDGDETTGGACYEAIYHEHSGSKSKGKGCYGKAVTHSHMGSAETGGGCYGQSVFHSHSGNSWQGGGCYGQTWYHEHSGNATTGGGCYSKAITHSHEGNESEGGACYATPVYHQHQGVDGTNSPNGCYTRLERINEAKLCGFFVDQGNGMWGCETCGWSIPAAGVPYNKAHAPEDWKHYYRLGCEKTEETVETYVQSCNLQEGQVVGYSLNCGKNEGTVEGYGLSCGKSESDVERYELNCGKSEGQIEEYKRNCGMTTKTVIGYKLVCQMEEKEPPIQQPVKVPAKVPMNKEEVKTDVMYVETKQESEAVDNVLEHVGTQKLPEIEKVQQDTEQQSEVFSQEGNERQLSIAVVVVVFLCLVMLPAYFYFKNTVALYYYDETDHYHSLGRIRFQRTQKGYHVEIGNSIRRKASTDRYRIHTKKSMQKASEKLHLYVRISSQIMKLGLEEYVDFAI